MKSSNQPSRREMSLQQRPSPVILAADVGGTFSRFAVFEISGDGLFIQQNCRMPTWDVDDFSRFVDAMQANELAQWVTRCTDVVVAVPGPVRHGRALNLPNVPWNLDIMRLREAFPQVPDDRVYLINDFAAHAMACQLPIHASAICVQHGEVDPAGLLAVIGAGTGMGGCSLLFGGSQTPVVVPSEAGHVNFAFHGADEKQYEAFLQRETGLERIDCNLVVSGRGLTLLHKFVTGVTLSPQEVTQELSSETEVCQIFATYYGRAARNYALSVLPTGGMYVAGGVAARAHCLVDHNAFRNEFSFSAAHHDLLSNIPIHLIVNEESGVWGAARYSVIATKQREMAAASCAK
jgi:glucokinase